MRLEDLPPAAQQQVLMQLREQQQAKAENPRKYRNNPTERGKLKFDSAKEASRFDELMLMRQAGKISDLRLQVDFTLQEAYTLPDGKRIRAIRYRADFTYWLQGDICEKHTEMENTYSVKQFYVVEDVKSEPTRKRKDYVMKKKLMQSKFGITIRET